jgi:dephospho-CoA kinase
MSAPASRSVPRVALTGGIASGKSTVARLFAGHGVPVIDTDEIARNLTRRGEPAVARIAEALGADLVDERGELDRPRLRSRVFADSAQRRRLEALLHPLILAEADRRSARAGGPYQIVVVPLLFEAGLERTSIVCWSWTVPRRSSCAGSGPATARPQQAPERVLAAQMRRDARLERADDVIVNDGTLASLAARVDELHAEYVQWARGPEK